MQWEYLILLPHLDFFDPFQLDHPFSLTTPFHPCLFKVIILKDNLPLK
jgi:hypothetical protein